MPPKKNTQKAVWAVSIAIFLVTATLIGVFLMQMPSQESETIILPPPAAADPIPDEQPQKAPESEFLAVDNENVLSVLQTLSRPSAYHQSYTVTVGADDIQSVKQVELWVNGNLLHAEISDSHQTKILVSDGTQAHIWYQGSDRIFSVALSDEVTQEDLLGLPSFDAFLDLQQSDVVDSGYLVLEDPQVQCIFVSTQSDDGITTRHWVDLESGLLYQSDVLEDSYQVYTIRQNDFAVLATEDESFSDRFRLPDGTDPFTAAEEMPQP